MEQYRQSLIRRASSSFKHNASFVARLPTIRRHKSQSLHSPAGNSKPPTASARGRGIRTMAEMNASAENLGSSKCVHSPVLAISGNWFVQTRAFARSGAMRPTTARLIPCPSFVSFFLACAEVTNNGRPMNPSLSEDSVADTAISKRNSDGMYLHWLF